MSERRTHIHTFDQCSTCGALRDHCNEAALSGASPADPAPVSSTIQVGSRVWLNEDVELHNRIVVGTIKSISPAGYVRVQWDEPNVYPESYFSPATASSQLRVVTGEDALPRHDWDCQKDQTDPPCLRCGVIQTDANELGPCAASAPAPTRFAWLMERYLARDEGTLRRTPAGTLVYWDGGHAESFTTDANKAKHWPTKEAAMQDCLPEDYAQWGWQYVEHGFMANPAPVSSTGAEQDDIEPAWMVADNLRKLIRSEAGRIAYVDDLIDQLIAAVKREASRSSSSEGWQPIETAPKDREVLLYGPYTSGALGLVQGAWNHGGAFNMPHWMGGIVRPTHWMPLPSPPAGSDRENK